MVSGVCGPENAGSCVVIVSNPWHLILLGPPPRRHRMPRRRPRASSATSGSTAGTMGDLKALPVSQAGKTDKLTTSFRDMLEEQVMEKLREPTEAQEGSPRDPSQSWGIIWARPYPEWVRGFPVTRGEGGSGSSGGSNRSLRVDQGTSEAATGTWGALRELGKLPHMPEGCSETVAEARRVQIGVRK